MGIQKIIHYNIIIRYLINFILSKTPKIKMKARYYMTYNELLSLSIDDFNAKEDLSLRDFSLYIYHMYNHIPYYDFQKHTTMLRNSCYSFEHYFGHLMETLGKYVKHDGSNSDNTLIKLIENICKCTISFMDLLENNEIMKEDDDVFIHFFFYLLESLFHIYCTLEMNGYKLSKLMKA